MGAWYQIYPSRIQTWGKGPNRWSQRRLQRSSGTLLNSIKITGSTTAGRMSTVNRRPVAEAMYLHMVGHQPRTRTYSLNDRYSELVGKPGGEEFKQVPVYGLE